MDPGSVRGVLSWCAIVCGVMLLAWSLFLFAQQARGESIFRSASPERALEFGTEEPWRDPRCTACLRTSRTSA